MKYLDDKEAAAWRAFMQMQEVLVSRLEQHLQRVSGLSRADYGVLIVLSEAPGQRYRVFELGELLGWEKSRLHHQLSRMCCRGLVRREPDPDVPRAMHAVITEAGLQAITEATPPHAAEVQRVFFEKLSDRQVGQLLSISRKVLDGLYADVEPECPAIAG